MELWLLVGDESEKFSHGQLFPGNISQVAQVARLLEK